MIAQSPNLDTIFKRHGIHRRFWGEFRAFLEEHTPAGRELQACLDHVASYKAAEKEALWELSKVYAHEYQPADRQFPYESLLAEDIVISPGAPSVAR